MLTKQLDKKRKTSMLEKMHLKVNFQVPATGKYTMQFLQIAKKIKIINKFKHDIYVMHNNKYLIY